MTPSDPATETPIDRFRGDDPTRDLEAWSHLWAEDRRFPVESHRGGVLGTLLVWFKRLLRPLVVAPQADVLDRQQVFNQILLDHLVAQERREKERERRLGHLENFVPRGLDDVLRHNDALFARVDQKLDRHRREATDLLSSLGAALAVAETAEERAGDRAAAETDATRADVDQSTAVAELSRLRDERAYLELERRYRGTPEEIRDRIADYVPRLRGALERIEARAPILDLGCGRGEALAVFAEAGFPVRGVDASEEMVRLGREAGFEVERGDLFATLAATEAQSLGAVVSFHVIEHLPPESLDRLVRLAWRALAPGGLLILETPNPLSLVVAARSFWLDPTHRRPVHPDSLALMAELAGFDPVERLDLRPHPEADRLPEISLASVPEEQREVADRVNRLRDRLDDLLFGHRDYAVVAEKPRG